MTESRAESRAESPGGSRKARRDLRLLYQTCAAELAFFKSQQWSVTYCGLLVYGVLLATAEIGRWQQAWVKSVLFAAVLAVGVAAIVLVRVALQEAIRVRRRRLGAARERLTRSFRGAWQSGAERHESEDWVHVFLCGVLALGALITGVLILAGPWRWAPLAGTDRGAHIACVEPDAGDSRRA